MQAFRALLAVLLLLVSTAPAQADFQYTETSQITGGTLVRVMKVASVFARGDAKKQERQALQPTTTVHYVSGNRLRTDQADGTAQIIDLDGRRVISMDLNKKTYGVATFDQIKAAMEQAEQAAQQNAQQNSQLTPQQKQELQNAQIKITPKIHVTPGAGGRTILNQTTNETKVQMDLAMQATATGPDAPPPGQPNSGTADFLMDMDTFVAPSVSGYQEFAQFYRRMAQEVNWMKLPALNVQIDPRVEEGMSELRTNSDALKGFPMLSYVSMSMAATVDGQDQTASQNQQPANPPPPSQNSGSSNSSSNSIPESPSAAVVKGLGSLFGKKKQNSSSSSSSQDAGANGQAGAPPPNPNSNPNALMEMTTQVTSFSDASLDGSLFDIPAGYTQLQEDPSLILAGQQSQTAQPARPGRN